MAKKIDEFIGIEEEFMDMDKDKKIAHLDIEYDKPSDIFNLKIKTKTPIFNDDFYDEVTNVFESAPKSYKVDLNVYFNDLENYTNEELQDIFKKNIYLDFKRARKLSKFKYKIAYTLIVVGIVFFIIMLLVNNLWEDGGLLKEIFSYVADITTTVTFWEAMIILVVETQEKRMYVKKLYNQFNNIQFLKK